MCLCRRLLRIIYKERKTNERLLEDLNTNLQLQTTHERKMNCIGHKIRYQVFNSMTKNLSMVLCSDHVIDKIPSNPIWCPTAPKPFAWIFY